MTEEIKLIIIIPLIVIAVAGFELLAGKKILSPEISRKLLHLLIGIAASFSPYIFDTFNYPVLLGLLSALFNLISIKYGILSNIDPKKRNSYGTVYFSIAFALISYIFWERNIFVITSSFLLFVTGDFFAGLSEKYRGKKILLNINSEPKTLNGAGANFFSTIIVFFILYIFYNKNFGIFENFGLFLVLSILTALISTTVELISEKGSDNFFMPLVLSLFLFIQFNTPQFFNNFLLGFVLGFLVLMISIFYKLLTKNGGLSAMLLAMFIFGLGSWQWTLPIFSFFVLSSLLSKFSEFYKKRNAVNEIASEKGSQRDMFQVIANGLIPLLIIIFDYFITNSNWYYIYITAIAIHTADTWGTEIGTAFGKNTYLITTFRKTQKGISGGISLMGSLGSFGGSFIIILIGHLFIEFNVITIIVLSLTGFSGGLIDSILGTTIQGLYTCEKCGKITEKKKHCNYDSRLRSGFKFINNDIVNFLSVFIVVVILMILIL